MLSILIRSKMQHCMSFFVRFNLPMRPDYPDSAFQMDSNVHVIRKQHYYCHTELRQLPLGGTLRMDSAVKGQYKFRMLKEEPLVAFPWHLM